MNTKKHPDGQRCLGGFQFAVERVVFAMSENPGPDGPGSPNTTAQVGKHCLHRDDRIQVSLAFIHAVRDAIPQDPFSVRRVTTARCV